jgi:heptosyltransferase-2
MGDIVLTLPIIQKYKIENPNSIIHVLTKERYRDIFLSELEEKSILFIHTSDFKELLEIIDLLKKQNYDEIIDFHNSLRSRFIRFRLNRNVKKIRYYKKNYFKRLVLILFKINFYKKIEPVISKYAGVAVLDIDPYARWEYPISEKNREEAQRKINSITGSPQKLETRPITSNPGNGNFRLCIMAASVWFTKRWPSDYIIELLHLLLKYSKNIEIFMLGGNNENQLNEVIIQHSKWAKNIFNTAGKININETAALLSTSDLLVTNDTGIMHIATGLQLPTIAIFGSTVEEFGFYPYGVHSEVLETNIKCRPCASKGRRNCPKEHFKCMMKIKPTMVYEKILKIIEKSKIVI